MKKLIIFSKFGVIAFAIACGASSTSAPQTQSGAALEPVEAAVSAQTLDGVWIEVLRGSEDAATTDKYEFGGQSRVVWSADGTRVERTAQQGSISSGLYFVSWRDPDGANRAELFDLARGVAYGAGPTGPAGESSEIWRGEITGFGLIDGGEFALDNSTAAHVVDPSWESDTFFEGRSLAYTYENGKSFSNEFHGDMRMTPTTRRGLLEEPFIIRALGGGSFLVSWVDTNMGHIAQVIDLGNQSVYAAVPIGARSEMWRAEITQMP